MSISKTLRQLIILDIPGHLSICAQAVYIPFYSKQQTNILHNHILGIAQFVFSFTFTACVCSETILF